MSITITTFFTQKTVPLLVAGIVAAFVLNTIDAAIAHAAGASAAFLPLSIPLYASFTVVGLLVGWIGWRIVKVKAANSRKLLTILVPVLTVASFIPDTILLITKFIPDTSTPGVVGLMIMHLIVVGCAVPTYVLASRRMNQAK